MNNIKNINLSKKQIKQSMINLCGTLLAFAFLIFFSGNILSASEISSSVEIKSSIQVVENNSFVRNDSLYVDFKVATNGLYRWRGKSLSIMPVYEIAGETIELPIILINGKKADRYYRRNLTFFNHKSVAKQEKEIAKQSEYARFFTNRKNLYTKIVYDKNNDGESIEYKYAISLRDRNFAHNLKASLNTSSNTSSKNSEINPIGHLELRYFKKDCCDYTLAKVDELNLLQRKTPVLETTDIKFLAVGFIDRLRSGETMTFIAPKVEERKIRQDTIKMYINYPWDKYGIYEKYMGNTDELSKLDKALQPFMSKDGYTLIDGKILAYTSPEGTYDYNMKLSNLRAESFYNYLYKKYNDKLNLPKLKRVGLGEDWDKLTSMIEESDLEDREEILDIISSVSIKQGREKHLMSLKRGNPYRYMMKTMFPMLRRMELTLSYEVKSFTLEESKNVYLERPQDLSQKELYDLAQVTGNEELLKEAVNYFPKDDIAIINASSIALIRGDLDRAFLLLEKVFQNEKAYNNIGIYYAMKGEYELAKEYFQKAMKVDKIKAEANLRMLNSIEIN